MSAGAKDWDPETYARFRGLRLRPALDLLAQIGSIPAEGQVVDLGCGSGAVGAALEARFEHRVILGLDSSPSMLEEARATGHYDQVMLADAGEWQPEAPPALIFSNAALHWLDRHERLMPHLAGLLAPGGVLAVQMPRQGFAPSHRFLRDFAADMFPDRFEAGPFKSPVAAPVEYHRILAGLGHVSAWETEYVQRLEPSEGMHPVRAFTESTIMRPYLAALNAAETAAFVKRYEEGLASAYPVEADGAVLFPFRRLFFTLTR